MFVPMRTLTFILGILMCCYLINNTYFADPYMYMTPKERIIQSETNVLRSYNYEVTSDEALRLLKEAIKLDQTNDVAYKEIAVSCLYRNEIQKWEENINKAIELNADRWQLLRGYYTLFFREDYKSALVDFYSSDLVKTATLPFGSNLKVMKGLSYLGIDDIPKAIQYFNAYIIAESSEGKLHAYVYYYLSKCYIKQSNFDKALEAVKKGNSIQYMPQLYYQQSLIYLETNKIQEAIKSLEQAEVLFCNSASHKKLIHEMIHSVHEEDLFELKSYLSKRLDPINIP